MIVDVAPARDASMRCARCQNENPSGARFCSACGAALGSACRACGAAMAERQRFCTACGAEAGAPAASGDDAERRHAIVMFSDLSGYTALNEALDPEEVEAVMARIKADATTIVEQLGGTVNQFVGDEIMALFGVPLARHHDARSAVTAALELHRAVDAFVATLTAGPARSLRMHTGINSGLVVARRSDARAGDFALTGDAVNTAARLRSLAAPGEILVSESVWRQVADAFEGETAPATEVKGKEQPLAAVRIVAARSAPAAGATPVIGRDEELREFRAVAEACAARGRARVVVVRGDPGVGKSRLVAEFAAIAASHGFACHSAAVLDFGSETGRDAVRSVARSLLGIAAPADDDARRSALDRYAATRSPAAEEHLFLHDLLDIPASAELRALAAAMSTMARERGSLDALCALATDAATTAPLFVAVEDIHWADPWTLERLAALAVLAAKLPLLLVMTTRFAGDPTATAWRTSLHGAPLLGVDLAPLTPGDARRLAELASKVASDLVGSCVERAEGNPLFLLQLLLDVGEATRASLPGSIQALVHSRMDRLAVADKAALQAAAVLGQRFQLDALRHLLESPGYDCAVLVEHFLVRPEGSELMFCHALIRDGAYASLLHARRRRLHARAAEWFAPQDEPLAAEHFDRADDPRAAEAYLSAGESCIAQFRYPAALALIERGLALATEQDTRFSLAMARGRVLVELGRSADAIEACRSALGIAASPAERARALIALASAMRLNDRVAEGLTLLDEAEPLAADAGLQLELARLHHVRGNLLFPLGRDVECLQSHERSLLHAKTAGSLEAEAAALGGIGDGYYMKGLMRSANGQFRACVALARENSFGRLEVANLPMIGWTDIHLTRIAEAAAVGREALALAMRASQPRAEIMARMLIIWVDVIRNRLEAVERDAGTALALTASVGAHRFEAQGFALLALVALRRGDRAVARERAEHALSICREYGMGQIGPWLHGVLALIETEPEARRRRLEQGMGMLGRGSVSHNQLQLPELAIDALLEIGDWSGVERLCDHLGDYTAAEPLPMADFVRARGLALAQVGRGDRSPAARDALLALKSQGEQAELNSLLPAVDAAIATVAQ
jgi:class 3 adenylate cyclase/tetratricopeptide (TPR) repeat protein